MTVLMNLISKMRIMNRVSRHIIPTRRTIGKIVADYQRQLLELFFAKLVWLLVINIYPVPEFESDIFDLILSSSSLVIL